jgi:hypothetical protein
MQTLTRTSLLEVSGTIIFSEEEQKAFQEAIMADEVYNPMGINSQAIDGIVYDQFIPDDDKEYTVTLSNHPDEHYIEVSVTTPKTIEKKVTQVTMMSLTLSHEMMCFENNAVPLVREWTKTITYPGVKPDAS